jgi:hypothetical protein
MLRISLAVALFLAAATLHAQDSSPFTPPHVLGASSDVLPRKLQTASDGDFGTITSKLDLTLNDRDPAPSDGPLLQRAWKLDDSWRCPLAGPLFVYGQFGGNSEEKATDDLKLGGKTGLACKLDLIPGGGVELRSGPALSYTDPLRPDKVREKSEWLLEVEGRWPLLEGLGLEYQGTLSPALTPVDRNSFTSDLHLATPLGPGGKLQLGARRRWEGFGVDARPTLDSMQLYLGLELAR